MYTVKSRFVAFIIDPDKEQWIWESNRCGGMYKIGFAQGPQKLNDGSRKMIHTKMRSMFHCVWIWVKQFYGFVMHC
jgi:hypothetical protein